MPVPAHPVFYEALDDYNLTSFSRLLKPRNFLSNGKGFISMNGIYQDPSAPVTLFIPTNEAGMSLPKKSYRLRLMAYFS